MLIEEYNFGKAVIANTLYTYDIIIYRDKIIKWWRKSGHLLQMEDLVSIPIDSEDKPKVIIIGTGAYGMMKVSQEVIDELTQKGIEIMIEETRQAIDKYNKLVKEGKKVVGAFHLTC